MPDSLLALGAKYRLVLGSSSPRRKLLLGETGVPFGLHSPQIEECRAAEEKPYDYALRLAEEKAVHVCRFVESGSIVLGCDTIVVLGDAVLEKPSNEESAYEILSDLAGKQHTVCTALALARESVILASAYDLTKVYFNQVSPEQIKAYVRSGEPSDKAGAYGIQGMGAFLVDRLEGNLDNVIGLPRKLLESLAAEVLATL